MPDTCDNWKDDPVGSCSSVVFLSSVLGNLYGDGFLYLWCTCVCISSSEQYVLSSSSSNTAHYQWFGLFQEWRIYFSLKTSLSCWEGSKVTMKNPNFDLIGIKGFSYSLMTLFKNSQQWCLFLVFFLIFSRISKLSGSSSGHIPSFHDNAPGGLLERALEFFFFYFYFPV